MHGEPPIPNLVLGALAAFVGWGRFKRAPSHRADTKRRMSLGIDLPALPMNDLITHAHRCEEGSGAGTASAVRPLAEVVQYKNVEVIRRFREQFPVSEREARSIFREMKSGSGCVPAVRLPVDWASPTRSLLSMRCGTHSYCTHASTMRSCMRSFGKFLHHAPTTTAEKGEGSGAAAETILSESRWKWKPDPLAV